MSMNKIKKIMINNSDNTFTDISSEDFREYKFSNEESIKIEHPTHLSVSKSGGHRIFDEAGYSHYIPAGWIHLKWRAKTGAPHFVK